MKNSNINNSQHKDNTNEKEIKIEKKPLEKKETQNNLPQFFKDHIKVVVIK